MATGQRASEQTFLFADLSGFTALTEVHGDEQAAELVGEFAVSVNALLSEHGAEHVHRRRAHAPLQGRDAGNPVGVRIVEEVGGQPGFPIIRAGMHTGPATERDGDWFGATVNSRRGSSRWPAVTKSSSATQHAKQPALEGIAVRKRCRQTLRNVVEPVLLFMAEREGHRPQTGLPIDPVCRMAVEPDNAAGSLRYDGVRYHFCSLDCAQNFAKHPERYHGPSAAPRGFPPESRPS